MGGMSGMGAGMPGGMGGPGGVRAKKPLPTAQTIHLRHINAESAASIARAFLTSSGIPSPAQIATVPESNSIIVFGADDAPLATIKELLKVQEVSAAQYAQFKQVLLDSEREAEQRRRTLMEAKARKEKEIELDLQKRHEEFQRNQKAKEDAKPKP